MATKIGGSIEKSIDRLKYQNGELYFNNRQLCKKDIEAIITARFMRGDYNFLQQIKPLLFLDDCQILLRLSIYEIVKIADYDCIYCYAKNKQLTKDELNIIANWLACNANEQEMLEIAKDIPQIGLRRIEHALISNGDFDYVDRLNRLKNEKEIPEVKCEDKDVEELFNWMLTNSRLSELFSFVSFMQNGTQKCCENAAEAILAKCLKEKDLHHLYKFSAIMPLKDYSEYEQAILKTYQQLEDHDKFEQVKYLFHYNYEVGAKNDIIFDKLIKDTKNYEYIAYQAVLCDSEDLLHSTFGNYESAYNFGKKCHTFFENEILHQKFLKKTLEKMKDKPKQLTKNLK